MIEHELAQYQSSAFGISGKDTMQVSATSNHRLN